MGASVVRWRCCVVGRSVVPPAPAGLAATDELKHVCGVRGLVRSVCAVASEPHMDSAPCCGTLLFLIMCTSQPQGLRSCHLISPPLLVLVRVPQDM